MTEREPPRQIDPDEPSPEALARVVYGESSEPEAAEVRQWLEQHPQESLALDAVSAATGTMGRQAPTVNVEAALARVHARMHVETTVKSRRKYWWGSTIALAAAAAVAFAVIAPGWWRTGSDWIHHTSHPSVVAQRYAVAPGTHRSIQLSDGTSVLLGPNSELDVFVGYGSARRDVMLRGTAAFDVRHDAGTPFVVIDGAARIQDVGTRFIVRPGHDSSVIVAVTAGSVRMGDTTHAAPALALVAGQRGAFHPSAGAALLPGSASTADTAWISNGLAFDDAPLDVVARGLADRYGVHVRIQDPTMRQRHFTGTFTEADSLDRVLSALRLALGARIERQGDTVRLSPTGSP
jgi:transmembrane sensor